MSLSNSQLRKIGKRVGKAEHDVDDLHNLVLYRDMHVEPMFRVLEGLTELQQQNEIEGVISGRPKRVKSIIRKLRRRNATSLNRMGDLAGVRIVCDGLEDQSEWCRIIRGKWEVEREIDKNQEEHGYRAIHQYVNVSGLLTEVQIRTIEQHVWADESESFGEKVKEGAGSPRYRQYLNELAHCLFEIERGARCADSENGESSRDLFVRRRPILRKLRGLRALYNNVARSPEKYSLSSIANSLVVFDVKGGRAANQFYFRKDDTERALREFQRISGILDEEKFDVVLLNTGRMDGLAITHARYYPDIVAKAL